MTEHHAGAFATVARGWVQHHPGQWQRWLVRRCGACHRYDWVELIYVDLECMTCLYCLSQDVDVDETSDPLTCVCNECGARSQVDVAEESDESEESEPDDGDEDEDEEDEPYEM